MYEDDYGLERIGKLAFAQKFLSHENSQTSALYAFWEYDPEYVYK